MSFFVVILLITTVFGNRFVPHTCTKQTAIFLLKRISILFRQVGSVISAKYLELEHFYCQIAITRSNYGLLLVVVYPQGFSSTPYSGRDLNAAVVGAGIVIFG